MATIIISDLTDEEHSAWRKALDAADRDYINVGLIWVQAEAQAVFHSLAPRQKELIRKLVKNGGAICADTMREDGGSLRGLTGPLTKTVERLQKRGEIRSGLPMLVTTTYNSHVESFQRAQIFKMDEATVAAFDAADLG